MSVLISCTLEDEFTSISHAYKALIGSVIFTTKKTTVNELNTKPNWSSGAKIVFSPPY